MSSSPGYSRDRVDFSIGGHPCSLGYIPAAEWIEVVSRSDAGPASILTELSEEREQQKIYDGLLNGTMSSDQLAQGAYDLLSAVSPFKWWETCRLLHVSREPQVMGRLALRGLDPWNMSVGVWCTAVYACLTEHADDAGKFKFDAQLNNPPAGVEDDDWGDDFETMVAQARQMPGMK